ncbi:phosphoglycerate dehydrogenase [Roseospirillum parvum]|uniref:D-3-phosphoglycerate dehydrogenase n=1 Tax=Roseospirillum parvum TaxID=83401 RepID=A0A1G7VB43_9PROT|nr:phosphoglycerate dehydrogenase [Roseospirillum parvum]SDG56788.1 D-3-phosphoglycerate dehydrogenase [Roseospirillum parvum]
MSKLSLPKENIRILLLESIHPKAVEHLTAQGYTTIEQVSGALDEAELIERIKDVHMVGIRSRTKLTEKVFAAAEKLFVVGCFCIGTNQVDLKAAKARGIPVFNAPYSNTRSVAEMVIGQTVMLMRGTFARAMAAHQGRWLKTADGSHEVRGKTLGIVGYGHIGTQVSVLAEGMGMRVRYYDIENKLPLGNATPCASLDELLGCADVVTLHVPGTELTRGMIGAERLAAMKPGGILINAARGDVVDIDALAAALDSGHLKGAAVDVFPKEPGSADEEFQSPLRGRDQVILTPHVGGSTIEAQANIGTEVAEKLTQYSDVGSTVGAVNMVEVSLPRTEGAQTRFMHLHRNVPGVLSQINEVFSSRGLNIDAQYLRTDSDSGYVVVDVHAEVEAGQGIRRALAAIDGTIRVRFLY